MMDMILPYAEFLAGIGCILLARLAFGPLKRFGAHGGKPDTGTIMVMDEMLIIAWILLVLVGLSLMVYPFI